MTEQTMSSAKEPPDAGDGEADATKSNGHQNLLSKKLRRNGTIFTVNQLFSGKMGV